ncbi:hypothetical protein Psta_1411 [Pirellula staleyi DSM 6068]|uniref:Uncharacterized protein n=1 Tax=Pirellula staleyi (strain ATCC 27377 / DSM 6068 / ICPB 4128) TaxID=530564 RepID=D2QWY3_PIRSD|nr:hypothetical protein [Pirellula staleyi]ADB16087.1 hypothetical protein Psta_1411 [Pirellula staleyi DSM 6068]
MDRRNRRLFVLAWLFLVHGLADLAVALYRCLEIAPSFTDFLATSLPRAQLALLVAWVVLGREPLLWRLLGTVISLSWIFTIFSAFHFPGYYKPSMGEAWLVSDFGYYFRPTGPGDLLLKAPVIVGVMLVPLVIAKLVFWWRERRTQAPLAEPIAATTHHFFQFRFQDILLWNLAVALVLTAIAAEPHEGWFEVLGSRWWMMSIQRATPYSRAMQLAAIPTSLAMLVAIVPVRTRTALVAQLLLIIVVGVIPALLVDRYCRSSDLVSFYAGVWRTFPREGRIVLCSSLIVGGSSWLVRLYDSAIRRRRAPAASLPQFAPSDAESAIPIVASLADPPPSPKLQHSSP